MKKNKILLKVDGKMERWFTISGSINLDDRERNIKESKEKCQKTKRDKKQFTPI